MRKIRALCFLMSFILLCSNTFTVTAFAAGSGTASAVQADNTEMSQETDSQTDKVVITEIEVTDVKEPAIGRAFDSSATVRGYKDGVYTGITWQIPVVWIDENGKTASVAEAGKTYLPVFAFYVPKGYRLEGVDFTRFINIKLPAFLSGLYSGKSGALRTGSAVKTADERGGSDTLFGTASTGIIVVLDPVTGITYIKGPGVAPDKGKTVYDAIDDAIDGIDPTAFIDLIASADLTTPADLFNIRNVINPAALIDLTASIDPSDISYVINNNYFPQNTSEDAGSSSSNSDSDSNNNSNSSDSSDSDTTGPDQPNPYRSILLHCSEEAITIYGLDILSWFTDLVKAEIQPKAVNLIKDSFPLLSAEKDYGWFSDSMGLYVYAEESSGTRAAVDVRTWPGNGPDEDPSLLYLEMRIEYNISSFLSLRDDPSDGWFMSENDRNSLDLVSVHEMLHAYMYDYNRNGSLGKNSELTTDTKRYSLPDWMCEGTADALAGVYDDRYGEYKDYYDPGSGVSRYTENKLYNAYQDKSRSTSDLNGYGAYSLGTLAVFYLSGLAAQKYYGEDFGTLLFSDSYYYRQGLDMILNEINRGKSLDSVINEISDGKYRDTTDFENQFISSETHDTTKACVALLNYFESFTQIDETGKSKHISGSMLKEFGAMPEALLADVSTEKTIYKIADKSDFVLSTVDERMAMQTGTRSDDQGNAAGDNIIPMTGVYGSMAANRIMATDASLDSGDAGLSHDMSGASDTADKAETADAADVTDKADTVDSADVTETEETADTADAADTADTTETADAADITDKADTVDSADVTETEETADTADAADTADTAGAAGVSDTADFADATDVSDTADFADAADVTGTAETADTEDAADTSGAALEVAEEPASLPANPVSEGWDDADMTDGDTSDMETTDGEASDGDVSGGETSDGEASDDSSSDEDTLDEGTEE